MTLMVDESFAAVEVESGSIYTNSTIQPTLLVQAAAETTLLSQLSAHLHPLSHADLEV